MLPVSEDANEKVAELELIVPLGPLIASVLGGGTSTANDQLTPTGSCWPSGPTAHT